MLPSHKQWKHKKKTTIKSTHSEQAKTKGRGSSRRVLKVCRKEQNSIRQVTLQRDNQTKPILYKHLPFCQQEAR